jgi:uncharacterized protein YprB with RNaseH-like and TPR domain
LTERRRLFFDIETSPNVGLFWSCGHEVMVRPEAILKERQIICVAWKWADEKRVQSLDWGRASDDRRLCEKFSEVIQQADEAIGHNGDRFDIRWLRTRSLYHRVPFPPEVISIDTLKSCRSLFYFNSNRLDYVAEYLGLGKKRDPGGFGAWKELTVSNPEKLRKKMVSYCKHDVVLLEAIFNELNPYLPAKSKAWSRLVSACPECGSTETTICKTRTTAAGTERTQLQCNECGKYHTVSTKKLLKEQQKKRRKG